MTKNAFSPLKLCWRVSKFSFLLPRRATPLKGKGHEEPSGKERKPQHSPQGPSSAEIYMFNSLP